MARDDSQLKLRLAEELRQRVQDEAVRSNQSMNALIVSVLELAFPQPTINLNDLSAFLGGVVSEWLGKDGGKAYLTEVNSRLATTKTPWTVAVEDGVVKFYPYADPAAREYARTYNAD